MQEVYPTCSLFYHHTYNSDTEYMFSGYLWNEQHLAFWPHSP